MLCCSRVAGEASDKAGIYSPMIRVRHWVAISLAVSVPHLDAADRNPAWLYSASTGPRLRLGVIFGNEAGPLVKSGLPSKAEGPARFAASMTLPDPFGCPGDSDGDVDKGAGRRALASLQPVRAPTGPAHPFGS
jgi:hypothetical protein